MVEFGIEGYGNGQQADVIELNKALSTGYDTPVGTTGGAALKVQSLENTLKILTFREEHCVMWKDITKAPAYNTFEEFSQQTSVGSDQPGFTGDGVLPEEDDSGYVRQASFVKFMGTTRKITHPMTLVSTIDGDAVARETTNGILKVMRDAEYGLYWGNSTLVYTPSGTPQGVEFDGLFNLISSANDIDLGNTNIGESTYNDMSQIIADNYGYINRCYMAHSVIKSLDVSMLPKERTIISDGTGGLSVGAAVSKVKTSFGVVENRPAIFLGQNTRNPKKVAPTASTSTKAPAAPASLAAGAMTGTDGKFRGAITLKAKVTACNRYGESAPCTATGTITVGSGDVAKHIPFTVTNSASSETVIPDYFNLYVTQDGAAGVYYYVGSFPCLLKTNNDSTANTFNYDGYIMPNTSVAFAGQFDNEILTFKQLAPIMKMDLATIEPSYRFMILMYGVPQVFKPKRLLRVVNIKDY